MRNFLIFFTAIILLSSCSNPPKKINLAGEAQGTYYSITYYDGQNRDFRQSIDSLLNAFNQSVSLWEDSSIICRINRNEPSVRTDSVFRDIFRIANQVSVRSNGAFDVSVGKLVAAWGFHKKQGIKPDSLLIAEIKSHIGYTKIHLQADKLLKEDTATGIDFNAIAQGYSVDMVGKFLETKGVADYLIDIGGEILGKGEKEDGNPWIVGIEKPADSAMAERQLEATVPLTDMALATSGNYRKYYEVNGIRYSHTIDPATGYPVRHKLLSATVLAKTAAIADAWATAFMVMGEEKAMKLIQQSPDLGLEAYFIVSSTGAKYKIVMTEGLKSLVKQAE